MWDQSGKAALSVWFSSARYLLRIITYKTEHPAFSSCSLLGIKIRENTRGYFCSYLNMDRRSVEVTYPFSSISPTFPYRAINRPENVQNKGLCGAECLKVGLFPNLLCNQRLKSAGHFKHRWGIKPTKMYLPFRHVLIDTAHSDEHNWTFDNGGGANRTNKLLLILERSQPLVCGYITLTAEEVTINSSVLAERMRIYEDENFYSLVCNVH